MQCFFFLSLNVAIQKKIVPPPVTLSIFLMPYRVARRREEKKTSSLIVELRAQVFERRLLLNRLIDCGAKKVSQRTLKKYYLALIVSNEVK